MQKSMVQPFNFVNALFNYYTKISKTEVVQRKEAQMQRQFKLPLS